MNHKDKALIKDDLQRSSDRQGEIVEAARVKIAAFDALLETYNRYKDGPAHDLKSALGTKAIELMEERYR